MYVLDLVLILCCYVSGAIHTLSNGFKYELAAEVALLTRNIKVRSVAYGARESRSQGGRVLVGTASKGSEGYTGYARVSNTEFANMGQEGYRDSYDPRYVLAYVGTGDVTDIKPSYMKGNTFHHCYSTAIGVFGGNLLPIEDNVVHRTVGAGRLFFLFIMA